MGRFGVDELACKRSNGLALTTGQWQQMRQDVERRAPEEACGLILGEAGRAKRVIPVTNTLRSPERFRMDPKEQLEALALMEREGLELSAIYHSHPRGPAAPSETDIAEAYYPDSLYLIWFSDFGDWNCRGFWIKEGKAFEAPLRIISGE